MRKLSVAMLSMFFIVLSPYLSHVGEARNKFPHKFVEVAIPEDELPKVIKGHPRLLIRSKPWHGGLSLEELKIRGKKPPWTALVSKMIKRPPDAKFAKKYCDRAALYYLMTGDESVVPKIVDAILTGKPRSKCGGGLVVHCMAYDWIYNSPSVTEEQRKHMADKIVKRAYRSAKIQEKKIDMWHHYGSGGWASDVLAAGLVLAGEHPEANRLLSWGIGYFKAAYLPGWQYTGGGWMGGGQSYSAGPGNLTRALACWESATEDGIFETIKRDYGNWLENLMYFMMYQILPDKSRVDTVGLERTVYKYCYPNACFMLVARGYKNPDGYAFLRWMGVEPKNYLMLYDEETDSKKPSFPNVPATEMWGRHGLGYVQMRSNGWEKDSTVIEFKCGDFIWSHACNHEHNGFNIYHKGRLAVKSGDYSDNFWFGNHTRYWYERTVSANSMLIIQPDEFSRCKKKIDGVDRQGFYPEYGGQRLNFGDCNVFTFDEYLARKDAYPSRTKDGGRMYWETGDLVAFEHAADFSYSYVCGDATQSYNNPKRVYSALGRKNKPKIDLFTRSMVFLEKKYLVVFDRVSSLDTDYRKAWLLHSIDKPEISGKILKAEVPGHIEDFNGDIVKITWGNGEIPIPDMDDPGRLFVKTFLPAKHYIRRIGGEGYEFWALGKNRLPKNWPRPKNSRGRHFLRECCNWRIEISPAEPAKFDNFLHFLYPCDTSIEAPPAAEMVTAKDNKMVGVAVGGWLVMFGRTGMVDDDVSYMAPAKKTEHLVVDLKQGAKYKVSGTSSGEKEITSSKEGTLRFATEGGCTVKVVPTE